MAGKTLSLHNEQERICEIADEYKRKGYTVVIEPSGVQLPDFLRGYSPDIVAQGPSESVVVEIKSTDKTRPSDYWSELAKTVRKQPGWRFEWIIDNRNTREAEPQSIGKAEIDARLRIGQRLTDEGLMDAALLITWSATEAALRLAGKKEQVKLPDLRPATLITRLYTDGILDRSEYDTLIAAMKLRNAVSHGFREGPTDRNTIDRLQKIASRLL